MDREHLWEPRALCRAGVRCAKCFTVAWEPHQNEPCEGVLPKPIASVYVSKEGNSLDIHLDTSLETVSEWINGEGGDIDLKRDRETRKVAGAHLPFYAKTFIIGGDNIPTIRIDVETGKVTVEKPE